MSLLAVDVYTEPDGTVWLGWLDSADEPEPGMRIPPAHWIRLQPPMPR